MTFTYIRIHYTSDTLTDYCDGLTRAKTLAALQDHVETYQRVAHDAFKITKGMKPGDFLEWRRGLDMERRKEFAGEPWAKKYGAVLMPEILLRVGMVANDYKVPWGLAYIRLKDAGRITEVNRIARWSEKPEVSAGARQ